MIFYVSNYKGAMYFMILFYKLTIYAKAKQSYELKYWN